ncbi:MAG TPA: hypothetical protein VLH61_12430, partial [Bacteroidales bacterium]|nr:hypothetical protein [Bacteroidales bacterium]
YHISTSSHQLIITSSPALTPLRSKTYRFSMRPVIKPFLKSKSFQSFRQAHFDRLNASQCIAMHRNDRNGGRYNAACL